MKQLTSFEQYHQYLEKRNYAVLMGNFDGVHKGHQYLIQKSLEVCAQNRWELVLLTFIPHPLTLLKSKSNFLINHYHERANLLKSCGIPALFEIPFTRDFSNQSPEEFLNKFILLQNGFQCLFVGHNFSFGAKRAGNHQFLKEYFEGEDQKIFIHKAYKKDDLEFSSSSVRQTLLQGDVKKASLLLNRPFFMSGLVTKGEGRGKKLGIPTANLEVSPYLLGVGSGVYLTNTKYKQNLFCSVTNVGYNPTFGHRSDLSIETHILDFNQDIYGEEIEVSFLTRHRDEKAFSNKDQLLKQIQLDLLARRDWNE